MCAACKHKEGQFESAEPRHVHESFHPSVRLFPTRSAQGRCALTALRIEGRISRILKLIDHNAQLTRIGGGFGFTEGPVWDPSGFLYVSDEVQNKIYRLYLDGRKEEVIALGDPDGNTL